MRSAVALGVLVATLALPACDRSSPTEPLPPATPTSTPPATATPSPAPTPTPQASPTPTLTPTIAPTPALATFSGRLFRRPELAPIAGALVELDNVAHHQTTTDGGGAFAFSDISPGSFNVSVTPPGEPRATVDEVWLEAGDNRRDLYWDPCVRPFGTVTDRDTGAPIAGATVTIWDLSATTGADGRYTIDFGCEPLSGGTIVMSVTHPDYQPHEEYSRASYLCTCPFDFTLVHL